MVSGSNAKRVHAEVQFTQNFDGPYALHGAYWHDRWGEKMSGGCVNLAPIDAKRMFEWTEPRLPPGWHGMRTAQHFGDLTRHINPTIKKHLEERSNNPSHHPPESPTLPDCH